MERFYFMPLLCGLLVWNLYITSAGSVQVVNDHHFSYCYNGRQEVISCNYKTQISITDLSYERKCTAGCNCIGNHTIPCGEFKPANSWKNYYLYDQLSGKSSGYFSVHRQPCDNIWHTYSNYVHVSYSCVDDDNIIQFGGVEFDYLVNKTGSIVYLQYVGGKHIQNDWNCTASTTSSHDLQVSAVDVRFQRYGVPTGHCDLGQKSYLNLSDNNQSRTFRCEDDTILGNYDIMFNSSESEITILLHLEGDPQFVWIAISAGGKGLVNLTCDEANPTNPPSTTIDTTSGFISSQTTDLFATTGKYLQCLIAHL